MSERGPSFNPEESQSVETAESAEKETRFGNKEEIVSVMEAGTAEVVGRIEDFYNVPPHRNVVEMAYVNIEAGRTRNIAEFVTIDDEAGHHVEAVFKPVRGEAKDFYNANGLGHDYPREVASYLISEHFGFDLVPPTTLRTINGHIGSLQLFMPYERYKLASEALLELDDEDSQSFMESTDVRNMAALDWIIANGDRHVNNYMAKVDAEKRPILTNGAPELIAIDNGLAFNSTFYNVKGGSRRELPGPYQFMMWNDIEKKLVSTPLPPELRDRVARGYDNRMAISEALLSLPDIEEAEIERMWQRTKALVDTGVFLSSTNKDAELAKIKPR